MIIIDMLNDFTQIICMKLEKFCISLNLKYYLDRIPPRELKKIIYEDDIIDKIYDLNNKGALSLCDKSNDGALSIAEEI